MSFPAKYGGVCNDCHERFDEGALIEYDDQDRIRHVACDPPEKPHGGICETCWTQKSLAGTCAC